MFNYKLHFITNERKINNSLDKRKFKPTINAQKLELTLEGLNAWWEHRREKKKRKKKRNMSNKGRRIKCNISH